MAYMALLCESLVRSGRFCSVLNLMNINTNMLCSLETSTILFDVVIVVSVISLLVMVESGIVKPIKTIGFYCDDPKLMYRFKGECVSGSELLFLTFVFPIFLFFFIEFFGSKSKKSEMSWFKRSCMRYVDFLHGSLLTLTATEIGKILFGEPRPHFLHSCKPFEAINCSTGEFIAEFTCTNKNYQFDLSDTYKSFPSGHTSLSCFTTLYFALYFNEKIRTTTISRYLLGVLYIICFIWALVCSFTRITDRRHHWWDVLFGAILGVLAAWYYYNRKLSYYLRAKKDGEIDKPVTRQFILPNA